VLPLSISGKLPFPQGHRVAASVVKKRVWSIDGMILTAEKWKKN